MLYSSAKLLPNFLNIENPKEEEDAVEKVLEDIRVEHLKPLGMELHKCRYRWDTSDVDEVDEETAEGNEPKFVPV